MKCYYGTVASALLSVVGLCSCLPARADVTVAGSTLLTAADQSRLASWLGEGQIALSNIYAKTQGDTSHDFHRAVDGKGRTFSVMQASNESGQTWLVGGYNPQSWSSTGGFHMTTEDNDRTAFLFNLTLSTLHRQTLNIPGFETAGAYQTYNSAKYGPTFGIGFDLYVPEDLTTGLSSLYSYVAPVGGVLGESVVDGTNYHGLTVTYGAIEVYTISLVPEPQTYAMLLAGLALLAASALPRKSALAA